MVLELVAGAGLASAAYMLYKYHTVAAAVAAVKAEVVVLEGKVNVASIEASLKADLAAAVAKIKSLL